MLKSQKGWSFIKNSTALACGVVAGFPGVMIAHGSEADNGTSMLLEEVVVTAQKREESQQSVGIAITTFSGNQMKKIGVENSVDIAKFTPGVSLSGSFAGQQQQFSIRGVTQNDFNDHVEAPNAVYIDEGYVAFQQGQIFASFDVERVEVLKGPQGTLFGRNATGGLVHFLTRKPTEEFEGYVDATYGSYDQVRLEGAVGGPISDTLRFRLSGLYNKNDGYVKNSYPDNVYIPDSVLAVAPINNGTAQPAGAGADLGGDDTRALRLHLEKDFGDNSSLLLSAFWTETTASVGPYQSTPTVAIIDENGGHINTIRAAADETREMIGPNGVGLNGTFDLDADTLRPVPGGDFFGYLDPDGNGFITSSDYAFDDLNKYQTYGGTARFASDFENITFTSVTDLKHHEKFQALDLEAGPADQFFWFGDANIDSFTQEFRLSGEGDNYRWVTGFYYLNIESHSVTGFGAIDSSIFSAGAGGGFDQPRIADLDTESYSLFGQIEYDLAEQWRLIAGIRGTIEKKEYEFDVLTTPQVDPLAWDYANPLSSRGLFTDATKEDLFTGKLQLDYLPTDDILIYGSFSRGVKAGSFNSGGADITDEQIPYDKEVLHAFELGFKSTLFEGAARFNAAAYYYDYKDYQASRWTGLGNIITNNDSTVKGFDVELVTSPIDNLDMMVSFGYIDAVVKDLNIAGNLVDVRPTFSPEVTASGLVRYTIPEVAGGYLTAQASVSYQSSVFHNLSNFDASRFDPWTVVDLRLSWEKEDGSWEVDAFVKNVFDERYNVIGFDLAQLCGCNEEAQGKPRWWGVSARRNF